MSHRFFRNACHLLVLPSLLGMLATISVGQEKKPPKVTYDDHVKPILRQKCFACHNPDKKSADLDLTNYTTLMLGGGSGAVIEEGDSESSYLYMLVTHDSEPYMPPESPKIADEMIETLRKWIDGGALENSGSTATMKAKPKFDLALQNAPTDRPEVSPMPERLPLEPVTRTPRNTAITALATSPWAPLVAVAGQQQVLLYNTQTLQLLGVLPFPEGVAQVLKFSRNGSLLLAGGGQGGASGRVIVWNIITGERIFEVGDELDAVLAADISSDQTLIALGGPQRVVRIFSTTSGRKIHELRKHTDWIYSLEFSPDSVLLASGDRNGGLHVWEGWTGREYLTLKGHAGGVTGLSWRADSNVLASCGGDGNVRLWEMENGSQIKNWGAMAEAQTSLEYARDGRLVSTGKDRVAKLWAVDGKQQRAFEAFSDLALEASFCDESSNVVAGDWTGAIRVWNAEDGKRLGELTANPPTLAERLQAASAHLAATQADHAKKAAALAAATAARDKMAAEFASLQAATGTAATQSKEATSKIAAAKDAAAKAGAAEGVAKKAVTALEPGMALLTEASAKSRQAAEKLAGDKELGEAAAKLVSIAAARAQSLDAQRKAVADAQSARDQANKDLTAATNQAATASATMKTAQTKMAELQPKLKTAAEKMAAEKTAADAATAAINAAQQAVDRWKQEAEFAKQQNSSSERTRFPEAVKQIAK